MKFLSALALVLSLGLVVGVSDAEAKRIGGGKSFGMQRQGTTEKAPTATPAQTPGTPAAAAAPAGAAAGAAAAAAPKRSWMGPLAGIAAGLGIAALASHLGFGEELASMLMMGLLAFAVIAVIGLVMRKRAAAQNGGGQRMAFSGVGAGAGGQPGASGTPAFGSAMPAGGSGSMIGANLAQPARQIPADFDVPAFVRNAKVQFIRLQAANDAGNLDDIREFTTPEMFAELKMDLAERGGATQTTEVMSIEADVTDVAEEDQRYVVSVRFTGTLREDSTQTTSFDEVWHLTKPRHGGGWVLAGIQQVD